MGKSLRESICTEEELLKFEEIDFKNRLDNKVPDFLISFSLLFLLSSSILFVYNFIPAYLSQKEIVKYLEYESISSIQIEDIYTSLVFNSDSSEVTYSLMSNGIISVELHNVESSIYSNVFLIINRKGNELVLHQMNNRESTVLCKFIYKDILNLKQLSDGLSQMVKMFEDKINGITDEESGNDLEVVSRSGVIVMCM